MKYIRIANELKKQTKHKENNRNSTISSFEWACMSYFSEFSDFKETIAGEATCICLSPGVWRICGRSNTELSVRAYTGLKFLDFSPKKFIPTIVIQQDADVDGTFPFLWTLPLVSLRSPWQGATPFSEPHLSAKANLVLHSFVKMLPIEVLFTESCAYFLLSRLGRH